MRENLPNHIAIIMDGNGRWAASRGQARLAGHQRGVEVLRDTMRACAEIGVKYLTVYAFSTENWQRPAEEVAGLMLLLENYLRGEIENLQRDNIGLRYIGDIARLSPTLQQLLNSAVAALAKNEKHILTLALNYGGRDEITRAVRKIADDLATQKLAAKELSEATISNYLDTRNIPDPDLLIRTAGEQRLSNFLLWQISYAELYFTEKCWAEFDRNELQAALDEYQKRRRKYGSL